MNSAALSGWFKNYGVLALCLALQLGYWANTKQIKPDMTVVPEVPGRQHIDAFTFGDNQFYFRALAFTLQNAGDTFGRFTALRDYDMNKLALWFKLLDGLDARSNMVPSMATYYYSQTQKTSDVRYIVDYLYEHSSKDIGHKWWWLVQSIYLAMHRLNDNDLALKVSKPLVNSAVPVWAQQMAAVVREKRGEMADALTIMESIKDNHEQISDQDLRYMVYFVKERLGKLKKSKEFEALREEDGRIIPNEPKPPTQEELLDQ